jgi:hypothetical protein
VSASSAPFCGEVVCTGLDCIPKRPTCATHFTGDLKGDASSEPEVTLLPLLRGAPETRAIFFAGPVVSVSQLLGCACPVVEFRFGEARPKLFVYLVVEPGTPRDWLHGVVERRHVLIRLVPARLPRRAVSRLFRAAVFEGH